MPAVVGCVDGTHICMSPPRADEAAYVNRHHQHSLNVLICSGADYRIQFVSAQAPGSWHDARVLRNSRLFESFETNGFLPFPGAYLLGDSAYPNRPWLLTPLPETANLNHQQTRYNRAHKRTRASVERTIGIWKQRFRVLLSGLRLKEMDTCGIAVKAMCVLHNLCLQEGDHGNDFEQVDGDDGDQGNNDHPDNIQGGEGNRREQIIAGF